MIASADCTLSLVVRRCSDLPPVISSRDKKVQITDDFQVTLEMLIVYSNISIVWCCNRALMFCKAMVINVR